MHIHVSYAPERDENQKLLPSRNQFHVNDNCRACNRRPGKSTQITNHPLLSEQKQIVFEGPLSPPSSPKDSFLPYDIVEPNY